MLVGDLNGFKQVNDSLGHLEGNRVLILVAQALRDTCRAYDYVARMGGDEFVIVLPEITSADVEIMTSRFCQSVVALAEREFVGQPISLSLGQAHYPSDGGDAEQLLAVADRTMYKVKRAYKQNGQQKPELQKSLLALSNAHSEKSKSVNQST